MNAIHLSAGVRVISNSEVDAFLRCQRKHFYQYLLDRVPTRFGKALTTGIIGHEVLAVYYKAIQQGYSKQDAYTMGVQLLSKYVADTDLAILGKVQALFARYVEQDTIPDTCEILAVEEDYYIPLVDQKYAYGMRLDLLVKVNQGRSAGEIKLVDHKFTYDFYSPDDVALGAQIPKYIATLRHNGILVDNGALNQFRTRFEPHQFPKKTNEDLFKREPSPVTVSRLRNSIEQQIITAERIMQRRALPLSAAKQEATPVLNKMTCKGCPFVAPCTAELNGENVDLMFRQDFTSSSYGYNKVAED